MYVPPATNSHRKLENVYNGREAKHSLDSQIAFSDLSNWKKGTFSFKTDKMF